MEPDKCFRVRPEIVLPEDQQKSFQHLRTAAIASSDLAERMNWKVGEKIFLTGDIFPVNPELTLVGIFTDPNTSETLFFSQTYLREMLGSGNARQDLVGSFQVQVERADQVGSVAKTIDDIFANSTEPTKSISTTPAPTKSMPRSLSTAPASWWRMEFYPNKAWMMRKPSTTAQPRRPCPSTGPSIWSASARARKISTPPEAWWSRPKARCSCGKLSRKYRNPCSCHRHDSGTQRPKG